MLDLKNIYKSFDKNEVLKDINLNINQGEIVALLGKSGSGKSTILNIIAGFENLSDGEVNYKEQLLTSNSYFIEPEKRNIGFVFQNYALFPHLNVFENISFAISHLSKTEQKKIVGELLELVNLSDTSDKFPHELSGGQQQRVAIARVLARDSDLILFDEPFASIDSMLKLKILAMIKRIIKTKNKTAIFVTHCPKEAILLSDKIAYVENGEIVQFDTPKNICDNPQSDSIKILFSKDNFLFKTIDDLIQMA